MVPLHAGEGAGRRRRAEEVDAARLRVLERRRNAEGAKQRKKRKSEEKRNGLGLL